MSGQRTDPEMESPPTAPDGNETTRAWGDRAIRALRRPEVVVLLLGLVLMAIDLWWVQRHRPIGSLDVDETGYLSGALRFHRDGTTSIGLLLRRIVGATSGPLVPTLSTPLLFVFGRSVWVAQSIQPMLHVTAAIAVTGIVRRHGSNRAALVAGIVALTLPAAVMLDRSYQLATGASAALCVAVWALLASDRGRRTGPMIAFGLAVAAMPMSRTMAIGFIPAVSVAALINQRWDRRSLLNLARAATACFLTAGLWWLRGWDGIMGYLQRSGYSDFAGYWGSTSFWGRFGTRGEQLLTDVRVPYLTIAACVAMAVGIDAVAHRAAGRPLRDWPPARRELLVIWTVVVGGYAALFSTPNTGTWFDLPLIFVAIAGFGAAFAQTARPDGERPNPLHGLVGAMAVCTAVATVVASVAPPMGRSGAQANRAAELFYVDTGRMLTGNFDADARLESADPGLRRTAADEWESANHAIIGHMARYTGASPALVQSVTGSGHLVNINTILLAAEVTQETIGKIELPITFDPEENLRGWLEPRSGDVPRIIVRIRAKSLRFPDDRFPERYDELVDELGWQVAEVVPLPDGGHVDILVHPDSDPLAGQRGP